MTKKDIASYTPLRIMIDKIGAKYEKEYRFDEDRRWRFDIAIPDKWTALEYDGGIFNNGRHVRGRGFYSDCEKMNMATLKGWRIYRFTILHFNIENYYSTLDFIKKIV